MKFGWCTPGSSQAQHDACRVSVQGTGVNRGRLLVCSCPECNHLGGTAVAQVAVEAIAELI